MNESKSNPEEIVYPKIKKLKIQRCQFGIPDELDCENGYMSDCNEPAEWSVKYPGDNAPFYVCEKHCIEIEEELEKLSNE